MLSRVSFITFAALSFVVAAHVPGVNKEEVGGLDPKCSAGYYPGFETSSFQYTAPAVKFFNATGSFFHSEWYTGPLYATHGKDNTIGSTRSGNFSGTLYTERLIGYARSPSKLIIQFTLSPAPLTFPATPKPVTFSSYVEELTVSSICAGTATYVTFTVVYCTKDIVGAYSLYSNFRRDALAALSNVLEAQVFQGTCPLTPSP